MKPIKDLDAVVVGGSIAGSLAAAALSKHVGTVTVLERDDLPDGPLPREGAPHAHQFHTLTAGGRLASEELLPGLTDELRAAGVPLVDVGRSIRYGSRSGWFPRFDSGITTLMGTRPFLESFVRRRVAALPNVTIRGDANVSGFRAVNGRIVGVALEGVPESRAADLVIDASGRRSQSPVWLEALGFERPPESIVDARWGYATTYVRPPDGWDPGFDAFYVGPTLEGSSPSATRGGAMWVQEGGKWVVTAQGCSRDYPPADLPGLREWFRSISLDEIDDLLTRGDVLEPVRPWRNTANRLRDFASLDRLPSGFIAIGDAVVALNPIYGQGMSSAAIGATYLERYLAELGTTVDAPLPDDFGREFHQRLARIVNDCWLVSTAGDSKVGGVMVDGVEQAHSAPSPQAEFMDRVLALATEDPAVAQKFVEMRHILRTPEWLADPELQRRVADDWERLGSLTRTATAR